MANHPSALKRHRQSEKKRARNVHVKSTIKGRVRAVREAAGSKKPADAKPLLVEAISELDRSVKKGVVHRRTAARKVARLSRLVSKSTAK